MCVQTSYYPYLCPFRLEEGASTKMVRRKLTKGSLYKIYGSRFYANMLSPAHDMHSSKEGTVVPFIFSIVHQVSWISTPCYAPWRRSQIPPTRVTSRETRSWFSHSCARLSCLFYLLNWCFLRYITLRCIFILFYALSWSRCFPSLLPNMVFPSKLIFFRKCW